ncbi:MAG: pantoate--beta-alanine ligase [Micrococcales bacterium]|nr:pantoate--beta-alanine ligase [Micrococcales bacterium]
MAGSEPLLAQTQAELDQALGSSRRTVVMTMGALHQGHLDLVDRAAQLGGQLVVTIFVNPLQFGSGEDFETYPRPLAADLAALKGRGVAVVFAPTVAEMYPRGQVAVSVSTGRLGQVFEGAARPTHFDGAMTVVLKLLQRTRASTAIFGQKDAQQLALIRQMVADLDLGVKIVAVPTRREADGLAMSSRNRYLDPAQRLNALALPRALAAGVEAAGRGEAAPAVLQAARQRLGPMGQGMALDYLELVEPAGFEKVDATYGGPGLIIAALKLGQTRLIDNAPITLGNR